MEGADPDLILALQLQAEEDAAARAHAHLGPGSGAEAELRGWLEMGADKSMQYEDEGLQALALSLMPLDEMQAEADDTASLSTQLGDGPEVAVQDALVQELLAWFKNFFTWVNNPPCDWCGSGATQPMGMVKPTPEEKGDGAGRVESYRCPNCNLTTRFARYTGPEKVLETRKGRCGEWANAFTLCCRALQLQARYVMDWNDHVWTEYWSDAQQRWVHVDPCEAAYDRPLLYEAGWGKPLTYVVAFNRDGVTDVMRRYTRSWPQVLERRKMASEAWFAGHVARLTGALRQGRPAQELAELRAADAAEEAELAAMHTLPLSSADLNLPGRQTGSEEWKASRGETGPVAASSQQAPLLGTRWRRVRDLALPQKRPGRLCGGAVRASGENSPSETALQACNGDAASKWLDFGGNEGKPTWLEYDLLAPPGSVGPGPVFRYSLTSANDFPDRDPADFKLEGLIWAAPGPAQSSSAQSGDSQPSTSGAQASSPSAASPEPRATPSTPPFKASSQNQTACSTLPSIPNAPAEASRQQQVGPTANGSQGGSVTWVVLDEQKGVRFAHRHQRLEFCVEAPRACRRYRLWISRLHAPANCVQLACWDLFQTAQDGHQHP
ncbi:hypothetical protein WJX84_004037 [Apatococcus fuscideae]|uniref:Transglutaminase-like domain-containing protein n=1 Tax=Apatococcus fuscideae TaxID=2026836 RepID=A0AAW1T558_9CHLO